MTSSIDTLLRAAQFLEEQELQEQLGTFYQPISTEKENISTGKRIDPVEFCIAFALHIDYFRNFFIKKRIVSLNNLQLFQV